MGKRLTYEFVKESFEKKGYRLLTFKYINSDQKLNYTCPNGHKHSIRWNKWNQKQRCPYCEGNAKLTLDFIRAEFKKEGYILLTEVYVNNTQKLDYICPEGHRHNISWHNWNHEQRCPYCDGQGKPTIEFTRSEFAKEDYRLLSIEYINNRQKLDYICPKGHRHNISWRGWSHNKNRCPECVGIISRGEVEVRDFIKSLGIEVLPNSRNQIFSPETSHGFELDIFMPTLNKAIEYNGEYWHQDGSRDLLKQKLCESKGISLLTIWDKEWLNENERCKNKIIKFVFNNEEVFK